MAKVAQNDQRSMEEKAQQLVEALQSKPGRQLLETIEDQITEWTDKMLNPATTDLQANELRQRIIGVLQFVRVWGSSAAVARSMARRTVERAIGV